MGTDSPCVQIGYCTNVHAGRDLAETKANLERYAAPVRATLGFDNRPMPVGLWLSGRTARDLLTTGEVDSFREWLRENGLRPFTFNGFPFGDFHSAAVKHDVYRPDWSEPTRVAYTKDLINIFLQLLPDGDKADAGVSTLPIGWRAAFEAAPARLERAARNLIHVAEYLRDVERETGKLIHLDLEPEPGCVLDRAADVIEYFEKHLDRANRSGAAWNTATDLDIRRYVRVCHDVCHAAVMFEDQAEMFRAYDRAGIRIGKVQVSSAVRVNFDALHDDAARLEAWRRLGEFSEPRYLHQTMIRRGADGALSFFDDLPQALAKYNGAAPPAGEWRIHFHVPVFLDRFGPMATTRDEIGRALALLLRERPEVHTYEVETYAWEVLPPELRANDLAEGIAQELRWAQDQIAKATRP